MANEALFESAKQHLDLDFIEIEYNKYKDFCPKQSGCLSADRGRIKDRIYQKHIDVVGLYS